MIQDLKFCKICRRWVHQKHSFIGCALGYIAKAVTASLAQNEMNRAFFPHSEVEIDGQIFINPII